MIFVFFQQFFAYHVFFLMQRNTEERGLVAPGQDLQKTTCRLGGGQKFVEQDVTENEMNKNKMFQIKGAVNDMNKTKMF